MDTNADSIEGKYEVFLQKVDAFLEHQKVAVWFKPFLELVKNFMNDIVVSINVIEGKLAVQRSVTDALATDRDLLRDKLEEQLQYTRRNRENTDDIVIGWDQKNTAHLIGNDPLL